MISVIVVGVLSVVWLVLLIRQRRAGRGSSAIAAAVCPIALLLLTFPLAVSVLQLIRGFQRIARDGAGGIAALAPYCIDVANTMWAGGVGVLVVMSAAALAQLLPGNPTDDVPDIDPPRAAPVWTAVLIGSFLLLPAVAAYAMFVIGIPRRILSAAAGIATSTNLGATSSSIASQVIAGVLLGACLSVVLLGAGVATLVAARRVGSHGLLTMFSWLVAAAAVLLGVWSLLSASADIQTFQRMVG